MAHIMHATTRLSFKYVDTYSHLDDWSDTSIKIKVLGGIFVHADCDDHSVVGSAYNRVVVLTKGLPDKVVREAIYSEFSHHGCAHTYDCCGCGSTTVSLWKKGKNEWLMERFYSRNC